MRRALSGFYQTIGRPLPGWSRVGLLVVCVLLFLTYQWPLWRISMEAPQYPRGLYMDVWVYKLTGGNNGQHIDEINTLNHYIGMHRIEPASFADLDWMPFALGILVLLTLRVAAIGNVRSIVDLSVLVVYVLGFMGARFVYKLYVFGHELDPHAPFHVEPFTPVIIGTKQIANFTTHSYPQLGTLWLLLYAAGVIGLMVASFVAARRRESQAAAVTVQEPDLPIASGAPA